MAVKAKKSAEAMTEVVIFMFGESFWNLSSVLVWIEV